MKEKKLTGELRSQAEEMLKTHTRGAVCKALGLHYYQLRKECGNKWHQTKGENVNEQPPV